jgi:hypothetical protein
MTSTAHQDPGDTDAEAVRALRPGRRAPFVALFLNGLLALTLLGIPYLRGRMRAQEAIAHFARFAECVYGGIRRDHPGLALPAGDRECFAARVHGAEPDWPLRCVPILRAMRPEPAIFLFPSPKQSEEELRRAIDLVEAELVTLQRTREAGRRAGGIGAVPERPLRAIGQLRAALANLSAAADIPIDPQAEAIALERDSQIVTPSRIPLGVASGGPLRVRTERGGLRAIGADARSVAEVIVRSGSLELRRVRRPSAARGVVLGPEGGSVLWLQNGATCAQDAAPCRQRLLGIGRIREGDHEIRPRWWLAAQPVGRLDRSVRTAVGGQVWVIAPREAGGLEALRFELPSDAPPIAEDEPMAPLLAVERIPLGAAIEALLVDAGPIWVEFEGQGLRVRGAGVPESVGPIAWPEGRPRPRRGELALARCGAWTAVAMVHGVAVIAPGAAFQTTLVRELREPVLGSAPSDDAMRLVCTDTGAEVIALDRRRRLLRWRCATEACQREPDLLAEEALGFDAAHASGVTVAAWTGDAHHPQIRLRRLRGEWIGEPEVPAPCWDSGQGYCGDPIAVAEGGRLLVIARENGDLLVLELADGGWRRLLGL